MRRNFPRGCWPSSRANSEPARHADTSGIHFARCCYCCSFDLIMMQLQRRKVQQQQRARTLPKSVPGAKPGERAKERMVMSGCLLVCVAPVSFWLLTCQANVPKPRPRKTSIIESAVVSCFGGVSFVVKPTYPEFFLFLLLCLRLSRPRAAACHRSWRTPLSLSMGLGEEFGSLVIPHACFLMEWGSSVTMKCPCKSQFYKR